MDINNNLINIIYKTTFEHYLDYEYMTDILKENYNKLLFLGSKRNDHDNQCISQNENKFENLQYINTLNNCKNDEKKIYKDIDINGENINNIINQNNFENNNLELNEFIMNNNVDLQEKQVFGNIRKVIRYKKTVYMNKLIIKDKVKKTIIKRKREGKRSSKYRGVSQNGIGWQTLMMYKSDKPYIGTYHSEELAARIYDVVSIKKNGIKSKTNFIYNNEQIDRILKAKINFKDKNISNIISELIN